MAYNNVYNNKKVLVTGNTGFKGTWLTAWLTELGADVYGYSKDIPTVPSMFEELNYMTNSNHVFGDIRDKENFDKRVQEIKPDFIFHLAAQAIVSSSYIDSFDTITTNVVGTASILEAIKKITWQCTCVLITSDKSYDNVEWIWGYRENDNLGGKDVYSGSKGAAELTIKSYWHSFIKDMSNINLGIARAGNVIGGGDWAKDRIVVDCIKAFSINDIVEIRSPQATRPWQHVLEPLSGYLALGQYLLEAKVGNGEAFNFGPKAELTKTVLELTNDLAKYWGLNVEDTIKITDSIPFEEAKLLKLNCDKSLSFLDWHSTLNYEQCVKFIADWYSAYYREDKKNMLSITTDQIKMYTAIASEQNLNWTY